MDAPEVVGNCDVEPTGEPSDIAMRSPGKLDVMPTLRDVHLSRRGVLAGCAVLLAAAAGCTTGAPKPPPQAAVDPLRKLFDEHVALRSAYDDAVAALPLDARLVGLRDNAVQHVTALAGALAIAVPTETSGAQASASTSVAVPPDPATLVPSLMSTETALANTCRDFAIGQPADRAPLLASLSAAHTLAAKVLS